jgi:hypothetical protein
MISKQLHFQLLCLGEAPAKFRFIFAILTASRLFNDPYAECLEQASFVAS